MAVSRTPVSTYRLQFNGGFRFSDALRLLPYLSQLGITDIYSSPLMKSRPGSEHGYDVTDPARLDPELGTEADFNALTDALREKGMGLLLDIVPNHMAADPENPWWRDVQARGAESPYQRYFDLDWLSFGGRVTGGPAYRRFFDVGDLVGVRVEDEEVFEATHTLVLQLIREGRVTGLRIDHIDGLFDPQSYLRRLRERVEETDQDGRFYILVEKILAGDESLPTGWPVDGTTGYEFAAAVNHFFVNSAGMKALDGIYLDFTGRQETFAEIVYRKKKQVIAELFPGEITALGRYLALLANQNGLDLPAGDATAALTELTARLPVYRTYITGKDIPAADRLALERAFRESEAGRTAPHYGGDFLRRVLLAEDLPGPAGQEQDWLKFVMRWQQLTGAIMAKGYEDTALYSYARLTSVNEVGGSPEPAGLTLAQFHRFARERRLTLPAGLNATSTHDTKRGEDVRARISVLSELADEWRERLLLWSVLNAPKKTRVSAEPVPEPETELFIYQTMLGAWPLDESELPGFKDRLKAYMVKAMREAKERTGWLHPDREYEEAVLVFIDSLMDTAPSNTFLSDFLAFEKKIARLGMLNSLSQLLLTITLPGVPDIYRGTELWDFSLVDPDNRRPVDFARRAELLEEIIEQESRGSGDLPERLLAGWPDGRIKMYLTWKALELRRDSPAVFQTGEYIPLEVSGDLSESVVAFIRRYRDRHALAVVPRFFSRLVNKEGLVPDKKRLRGGFLALPAGTPGNWRDILTGKTRSASGRGTLPLEDILGRFPLALLYNVQ